LPNDTLFTSVFVVFFYEGANEDDLPARAQALVQLRRSAQASRLLMTPVSESMFFSKQKEISSLSQTCRQLTANNSALETRLKQQEEELLSLRQQLLRTNLEKDKLSSEKVGFQP